MGANPKANFGTTATALTDEIALQGEPLTHTVIITNLAPSVQSFSMPEAALVGEEVVFAAAASDRPGDNLAFKWDFGDGSGGAGPSVSHTFASEGVFTVKVEVTDEFGGSALAQGTIRATPDRKALLFSSNPILEILEDASYRYQIATIEPGAGQVLRLTAPLLPTWLTFQDSGNGAALLAGKPSNDHVGSHPVVIELSDGDRSVRQTFSIWVQNVNDPPVISGIPDQEVKAPGALGPISFSVQDLDSDPGLLQLSVESLNEAVVRSADILLGGSNPQRNLTLWVAASAPGTARIRLKVSDGELQAETVFTLTVTLAPTFQITTKTTSGGSIALVPATFNSVYQAGTTLEVTAIPQEGFMFVGWAGSLGGTENPKALTVTGEATIEATFRDSAAPILRIDSPLAGPSEPEIVNLTGTVTDNIALGSTKWFRDGVLMGELTLVDGRFSIPGIRLSRGTNKFESWLTMPQGIKPRLQSRSSGRLA